MARKTIIWSSKASDKFDYYFRWYLENARLEIANKFTATIYNAIDTIADNPYVGRRVETNPNAREYVIRKFPFLIFYTIDEKVNIVNIATIIHAKMKR